MDLHGWKGAEGGGEFLGAELEGFFTGFALDETGGHAGDGDGGLAAEGLEGGFVDDFAAVDLFVFEPHPEHVATIGTADGADGIGIGHFTEVFGVGEGGLEGGFVHGVLSFEFYTVAGKGWIHFLAVGVDAAGEGFGFSEAVADEVGDGVEDAGAGVVVEDEGGGFVPGGEDGADEILGEEGGAGDGDGFVFFAGADVEDLQVWVGAAKGVEVDGGDLEGGVGLVAVLEELDDLIDREVFVAGADLGEGFGGVEAAALATADVVGGEEGALGTGAGLEDLGHGHVAMERGWLRGGCGHGWMLAREGRGVNRWAWGIGGRRRGWGCF